MHLDGARLWEAISAQATGRDALAQGLKEYCACFDSVSLCFSKGLGAPIGSMIIGSHKFIEDARHKRKALGGGLRQAGFITAPARVAVEQTFLGGLLRGSHDRAREVADMWVQRGGKLERETETNMVWLDLEAAGLGEGGDGEGCVKGGGNKGFVEMAVERGVKVMGGRLVVHYRMSCSKHFIITAHLTPHRDIQRSHIPPRTPLRRHLRAFAAETSFKGRQEESGRDHRAGGGVAEYVRLPT